MRSRRWLVVGAVVGLVAVAMAWRATAGSDERTSFAGEVTLLDGVIPSRMGITLPPGTPIGAGLEVATGSYLLGGPLPYLYSTLHGGDPIEDDGFAAHLLVTEPIRDVVDRYRAQAVAAGFEMSPVSCATAEGVLTCGTRCNVACGFSYDTGYDHNRSLAIGGEQGRSRAALPPVSHLNIDYRLIGDPPFPTAESPDGPEGPPERGSVPVDWPPLPDVGDPIYSFNDFEVAPGTVLLAHGLGATDSSAETTAIFEVTDDIDTVIARFATQPGFPEDNPTRETLERGDDRVDHVYWSDGHSQSLVFYDLADGPTILVLSSYLAD